MFPLGTGFRWVPEEEVTVRSKSNPSVHRTIRPSWHLPKTAQSKNTCIRACRRVRRRYSPPRCDRIRIVCPVHSRRRTLGS